MGKEHSVKLLNHLNRRGSFAHKYFGVLLLLSVILPPLCARKTKKKKRTAAYEEQARSERETCSDRMTAVAAAVVVVFGDIRHVGDCLWMQQHPVAIKFSSSQLEGVAVDQAFFFFPSVSCRDAGHLERPPTLTCTWKHRNRRKLSGQTWAQCFIGVSDTALVSIRLQAFTGPVLPILIPK